MFSTSELIVLGAIKQWNSFLTEAIGKGLKGKQLHNAIPHRRMTATIYKNYPQGKITVTDFLLGQYYLYEDALNSQEWIWKMTARRWCSVMNAKRLPAASGEDNGQPGLPWMFL